MDDIENKLGAILGNPEIISQIMNMAQQFGASTPAPQEVPPQPQTGGLDMAMLTKLAGAANSSRIDSNQQTLLSALRPYLTKERITKLEKAMRAAKIAGIATTFLGNGNLFHSDR